METQLKKGDTFLRISKYGKVLGVVELIFNTTTYSDECNYENLQVKSTNGVTYDYSECYKVSRVLNEMEMEKRKKLFDGLKMLSERKGQGLSEIK